MNRHGPDQRTARRRLRRPGARISPARRPAVARVLITVVLAGAASWSINGCGTSGDDDRPTTRPAQPVETIVEEGPVRVTMRAAKDRVTVAERVDLELEVETDAKVEVDLPAVEGQLGEFQVRDVRTLPSETREDRLILRKRITLDVYLPDTYEIPPMEIAYRIPAPNADGGATEGRITTEPLAIQVTSLLEGQFDPTKYKDIKPAVEVPLPRERTWTSWLIGVLVVAAAVAVTLWLLRRRHLKQGLARAIPPHEWALDLLRQLADSGLVDRKEIPEFYFRLTFILRRYIEWRFGIMAAEQTTEEFLSAVKDDKRLNSAHKQLLGEFLQAADLVKFARYLPEEKEIGRALRVAEDFVRQTAQPSENDETSTESAEQQNSETEAAA